MIRLLCVTLLALLAFAAPDAHGRQRSIETQANGTGATAEAAVRAAILDAVRRVNGPTVAADPATRGRFDDAVADLERALSAPDVTVAAIEANARDWSNGLVERVRVLSEEARPDGAAVAVTVLASVARFETSMSTRKTLAVVPFRTASASFGFDAQEVAASEIARRLADRTVQGLVRANVVTVLDRDFVEASAKERSFVETYGRTPEELARFGRMLGADYLLVGSIESAGLVVNTRTVEASGYTMSTAFAGMDTSARLLDVATGAIVWADAVNAYLPNSELARGFGDGGPNVTAVVDRLVDQVSGELTERVVETIAPIKVAHFEVDTVWLNRGTGRLAPGQRLTIRGGGQEIRDPDTGESLGQAERTVAVVEVVVTDARKSQCRLIEGNLGDLRIGQLARPMARP